MDTKAAIHRICSRIKGAGFVVEYWDGDRAHYGDGPEEFTLCLRDKTAVTELFTNLHLRFGEAYMDGRIDVRGDIQRLVRLLFIIDPATLDISLREKLLVAAHALGQLNRIGRARHNISHHYDLGNAFFRLWLDREMTYSCAYFKHGDDSIDQAQEQKLDHLCKKLRLTPDSRVLDIGCGWGSLALRAAKETGSSVVGITLSREQHQHATERAQKLGLSDRVRFRLQDYRKIPENSYFDRVVSVGMFEHVGPEFIGTYLRKTAAVLRDGGMGILHTMGRMVKTSMSPWITKHIFPGLYLPSLAEITKAMGFSGLNVVDIENLRLHYALTLDRWSAAFEERVPEVQRMFDERFVRMWRLYLNCSAATFKYGDAQLWQVTYTKGLRNDWPLTRDYLYGGTDPFHPAEREPRR